MNPLRPALLAGLLAACARGGPPAATARLGDLEISQAFAFEPITPASGAAYFRIANHGAAADTLLAITSPAAAGATIHGRAMAAMTTLEIPAGGSVTLEPGGAHVMLHDYSTVPKAGGSLELTLTFAHAGPVTLSLPVRAYGE
jgi:copper(I)-binding protein